jgi:hypothetical protein
VVQLMMFVCLDCTRWNCAHVCARTLRSPRTTDICVVARVWQDCSHLLGISIPACSAVLYRLPSVVLACVTVTCPCQYYTAWVGCDARSRYSILASGKELHGFALQVLPLKSSLTAITVAQHAVRSPYQHAAP